MIIFFNILTVTICKFSIYRFRSFLFNWPYRHKESVFRVHLITMKTVQFTIKISIGVRYYRGLSMPSFYVTLHTQVLSRYSKHDQTAVSQNRVDSINTSGNSNLNKELLQHTLAPKPLLLEKIFELTVKSLYPLTYPQLPHHLLLIVSINLR